MTTQSHLSKEKQEQYTRVFLELDEDRNGWLSREEVGNWLRKSGYNLSEQQIESIFRIIDSNADGKITLDEFYNAMELINKPPDNTENLRKVFEAMDTNKDGQLSEEELWNGLRRCGYTLTKEQVRKFVANLDKDGDGLVSFKEFIAAFK